MQPTLQWTPTLPWKQCPKIVPQMMEDHSTDPGLALIRAHLQALVTLPTEPKLRDKNTPMRPPLQPPCSGTNCLNLSTYPGCKLLKNYSIQSKVTLWD